MNDEEQAPKHICEGCGHEMHAFRAWELNEWVEGYECDECGWSIDTLRIGKDE